MGSVMAKFHRPQELNLSKSDPPLVISMLRFRSGKALADFCLAKDIETDVAKAKRFKGLSVRDLVYVYEEEPDTAYECVAMLIVKSSSVLNEAGTVVHEAYHTAKALYDHIRTIKRLPKRATKEEFIAYMTESLASIYMEWARLDFPDSLCSRRARELTKFIDRLYTPEFWEDIAAAT